MEPKGASSQGRSHLRAESGHPGGQDKEGNSGKHRQTKELKYGSVWEYRNEEWFQRCGVGGGDGTEAREVGVDPLANV